MVASLDIPVTGLGQLNKVTTTAAGVSKGTSEIVVQTGELREFP